MSIETVAVLVSWQERMQALEEKMSALSELFGIVDEPFPNAVFDLMGAYTKLAADHIGWCGETLEAWWCEHNFGEKPMQIGFPGEPMCTVSTIEGLVAFIAEDLRRADAKC